MDPASSPASSAEDTEEEEWDRHAAAEGASRTGLAGRYERTDRLECDEYLYEDKVCVMVAA